MSAANLVSHIFSKLPSSRTCNLPQELLAVGSNSGRQWIFPAGPSVMPVLASWRPYRLASRTGWQLVQLSHRAGVDRWLPGSERIEPDASQGIDWRKLGWKRSIPPVPVMYVGAEGPSQKAVLHLVDPISRRCDVVVKVPLGPDAAAGISRESHTLAALEDEVYRSAPRLVYVDTARGISTQRYVEGRSGDRRFLPEYMNLLRSLMLVGEQTTLAGHAWFWQDHPLWNFLTRPHIEILASALAEQADTSSLPACWVHGDFAPWNIRQRRDAAHVLIDWESSERAGLPLHDAFHFLHVQDFLFGAAPQTHHDSMQGFAHSLGISPALCRSLEIAYLGAAFFATAISDNPRRSEFILKSLAMNIRSRLHSTVAVPHEPPRLRLVSSRPANHCSARAELFTSVIAEMDAAGIPYCVLSGYESLGTTSTSDVDIMFRPQDLKRVPRVLASAARRSGAEVVQSIQHETSACYFVLARATGRHVTHLAIDCYGDYRREGRTWLSAKQMIAARQQFPALARPDAADELIYLLIKKVLKQAFSEAHLERIRTLFSLDPYGCRERLCRYWGAGTAIAIQLAIGDEDLEWFRSHLPELRTELLRSAPVTGRLQRLKENALDLRRLIGRLLHPTGAIVVVTGNTPDAAHDLADRLVCNVGPAFRWAQVMDSPRSAFHSVTQALRAYTARLRSTLVIRTMETNSPRRLWFCRPDIVLEVAAGPQTENHKAARRVVLKAAEMPDELIRQANSAVLSWLAARVAKRLKLPLSPPVESVEAPQRVLAGAAECEHVGLD